MLFEYNFEDNKYYIVLDYFDKDYVENGDEIFSLQYSDDPKDWEEYVIKVFRVEGDELSQLKVTTLPKPFLDMMGDDLQRVMPKTFVANPYFDELLLFFGNTILTSQDRFKPIACEQCGKQNLYEKKGKDNKADYIQDVHAKLKADPNPDWPFKGKLQVQFFVSDKQSRLDEVDLDNLAKAILDSLKGVVFQDDAQIVSLTAGKEWVHGTVASMVAVKQLEPDEKPKLQDYLFSGKTTTWRDEYKAKIALGKSTRFSKY